MRPLASPKPQPGVISEWLAAPVSTKIQALRKRSCGQSFGIVFLETFFRGVRVGEDLDVLGIANLLAGVDVDVNGHRWIPYALAFFALGVTSRFGLRAFNARSIADQEVNGRLPVRPLAAS